MIKTVLDLLEDLQRYAAEHGGDCEVYFPHNEFYALVDYATMLRRYTYQDINDKDSPHKDLHYNTPYGRVTIKLQSKVKPFILEFEDVPGFFGFSSVGTKIAI